MIYDTWEYGDPEQVAIRREETLLKRAEAEKREERKIAALLRKWHEPDPAVLAARVRARKAKLKQERVN